MGMYNVWTLGKERNKIKKNNKKVKYYILLTRIKCPSNSNIVNAISLGHNNYSMKIITFYCTNNWKIQA